MSIATQISRIESNRNTIRDKLVELGMATTTDKLDTLAAAVENIVNRGAVSVTVQEGDTYTIPAGYHNGSGTVSGVAGGGDYNLQSKTATPTKKQQSITPDSGYYGLSDVTIAPIPDAYQDVTSVTATAGDVLVGKIYVNETGNVVAGTMPDNGTINKTLDTSTVSYTIPKGNHSGTGKVSITPETKTVTPTKSTQNITPTAGKVLSKVTVDAIPDSYVQPTKTGVARANGTYNVREYVTLSVNVESSGSSLPTSTLNAGSAIGGTLYYIDKNGQGQNCVYGDTVTALKGSYFVLDWAGAADGYYLEGCEIVRAYGPVETTVGNGDEYYVMILKITGDSAYTMI